MSTLSVGDDKIVYDTNYALGYVYISERISDTDLTTNDKLSVTVSIEGFSLNVNAPGARYFILIDVIPSVNSIEGATITAFIERGAHTEGTSGPDFNFVGSCNSVENICTNSLDINC